jgi:hypothetical protein
VTQKVDLPAGRVQVTVKRVAEPVQPDRFWAMMESIWAAQRASGRIARTREEIDAEIEALRNESEDEMQAVERYPFCRTILAGRGSLAPGPHMIRCRENLSRAE